MRLMLDSGAYSAWTKDKEIDIKEYTKFALENEELFDYIITLDVIPGTPYKLPTEKEKAQSAMKGWQNFKYMLKSGVPKEKLIHVFHQGEDKKWLVRMMKECDYVGIAPSKDRVTEQKRYFLDEVGEILNDNNGNPLRKTHGFGVTSEDLLKNFPWASADSSSWVSYGRYGCILVPQFDQKKAPFKVTVTKGKRSGKRWENIHNTDAFDPLQRITTLEYLKKCDFTLEAVSDDHLSRDKINMLYYMRLKDFFGIDIWFSGNFALLAKVERELEFQEFFRRKGYEYKRLVSYGFKDQIQDLLSVRKEEIRVSRQRQADYRARNSQPRPCEQGGCGGDDPLRLYERRHNDIQWKFANKLPI